MLLQRPRMAIVRTTVATERQAEHIAQRLADGGAACVHMQRVRSFYDWQGKRHDGEEWLVEARTTPGGASVARSIMLEGHPYEIPIVESWRVHVNAAYARWADP